MLFAKIKDIKLREKYNKFEKNKLINKFLFINLLNKKVKDTSNINLKKCNIVLLQNQLNNKRNSKVRIVRRCIFNNRNRGVLRSFGISRIYLKELIQFGVVPGYSKSVW